MSFILSVHVKVVSLGSQIHLYPRCFVLYCVRDYCSFIFKKPCFVFFSVYDKDEVLMAVGITAVSISLIIWLLLIQYKQSLFLKRLV